MLINNLYHTWNMRIRQLQPTKRKTRIRNFAWLIVGIHQSRSVYLIEWLNLRLTRQQPKGAIAKPFLTG